VKRKTPGFVSRVVSRLVGGVVREAVRETHSQVSREIRRLEENQKALDFLDRLLRPLEPWSGWTMPPAAILTVVNDILLNHRATVVECGAGLSTLYAAKALSLQGGRLISIESDPAWAERVAGQINEFGLAPHALVVNARLTEWAHRGETYLWYDVATVEERLAAAAPVDLLVVDGPSRSVCRHARYPALPVVKPHLGHSYGIILHDIDRPDEREVVDRWRQEVSAEFINDYRSRGVSYAREGPHYEA
jgi:hypothetical protein